MPIRVPASHIPLRCDYLAPDRKISRFSCATSYSGDIYPSSSAWNSRSTQWCKDGAAQQATAIPTSSETESGSGLKTSAAIASVVTGAKSTAGGESNGCKEGGVLLTAAVGIIGAVL